MAIHGSGRPRASSAPNSIAGGVLRASAHPLGLGRVPAPAGSDASARRHANGEGADAQASDRRHGSVSARQADLGRRALGHLAVPGANDGVGHGPAVYAAKPGLTRSTSAPAMGMHLAPLLGPMFGAQTTKTSRQIFLQLLAAEQTASTATGKEQLAAQFDVGTARNALLRRDLPQAAPLDELVEAPLERALESILTDEALEQLPAKLSAPFAALGDALAGTMENLSPERLARVMRGLRGDLRVEYPRAWSERTPDVGALVEGRATDAENLRLVTDVLRAPMSDRHACLAAMSVMRACFLGMKSAGLDSTLAPWLRHADAAYQGYILDHKGNRTAYGPGENPKDAVAGITLYGAPSPLAARALVPGARAVGRHAPNLDNAAVREAVAWANPYASGLSGTTNLFVHAAAHFNQTGAAAIDGAALTTLLSALLCYDGGHSIHEVYAVAAYLRGLAGIDLDAFRGYAPGHARGTFVALASERGVTSLEERSFARLADQQALGAPDRTTQR